MIDSSPKQRFIEVVNEMRADTHSAMLLYRKNGDSKLEFVQKIRIRDFDKILKFIEEILP